MTTGEIAALISSLAALIGVGTLFIRTGVVIGALQQRLTDHIATWVAKGGCAAVIQKIEGEAELQRLNSTHISETMARIELDWKQALERIQKEFDKTIAELRSRLSD